MTDARVLRRGEVTLFLAAPDGRRLPVVTLDAPAFVAPGPAPAGYRWVEQASLDGELEPWQPSGPAAAEAAAFGNAVLRTVTALGDLIRPAAIPPPERVVLLGTRPTYVAAERTALAPAAAWVQAAEGAVRLAGAELPAAGAPVAERLALRSAGYTAVSARPLSSIAPTTLAAGVGWLFSLAADLACRAVIAADVATAGRIAAAPGRAAAAEARGVRLLAAELGTAPPVGPTIDDPLVACVTLAAAVTGLAVRAPEGGLAGREGEDAVRAVAVASGLYVRRVVLRDQWWLEVEQGVAGFRADGTPVAFVPDGRGRGLVVVDANGERRPLPETPGGSTAIAADDRAPLLDVGFVFAAPLTEEGADGATLARIALARRRRALLAAVGWAALIALLALTVPLASGVVFGEIIPESDRARLAWLMAALVTVALAGLPLQLAFVAAITRFEAAASLDVQRSVWGRVLRGPVAFVKRIGAGDLAMRLGGLEAARDPLDTAVLRALPTVLSGLAAGGVLFTYQARLAVVALVFGVVLASVSVAASLVAARHQRDHDIATGEMNGFLFQLLAAIPKLRVAAAESRAFLAWAERFRGVVGRQLIVSMGRVSLVGGATSMVGTVVLFAAVAVIGPDQLSIGSFLAFQVTYSVFLGGVAAVAGAAGAVAQQRPTLDRVVEVAQVPMESGQGRNDPGRLRGGIALAGVTFRYVPTQRPVLDDLSLRIEPGEMVALAGHSGCGKSTIIRLLLGFEQPEQGSVLFDDQDLTSLDVEAVRRQMGVVLQDGQLFPGSVGDNIAGVASLSKDELWELAEVVALAEDIRAMPMGLDTPVMLNGGAFSGGQRQRLVIARALASRPRILLLDEATSALDNVTQRVITDNLAQLGMTRVVVAHRLSTMAQADRIVVLAGGRVVETGTYDGLLRAGGPFATLAERQLL